MSNPSERSNESAGSGERSGRGRSRQGCSPSTSGSSSGGGGSGGANAMPAMAVRIGRFTLLDTIGEGSYAKVKLAVEEATGKKFAVKIFDRRAIPLDDNENDIKREVKIMQYLRHQHIVSVHQVLMSTNNFYIVMELVSCGELYYEIVKNRRLAVERGRRYFQQLVDAMCYCHAKGVYHRDLKPENLLIDDRDRIKITDFGLSFIQEIREDDDPTANKACRTQCGTPKYMAPEMIMTARSGYNGAKIDAWDCGLILYAMLAGFLPFNGSDDRQVFLQIVSSAVRYPNWFDEDLCDLLGHLLEKNPDRRWSLEAVRNHPWFLVDYRGDALYHGSMNEVRQERRARAERGRGLSARRNGSISRTGQRRSRSRSVKASRSQSGARYGSQGRSSERKQQQDGARSRSASASSFQAPSESGAPQLQATHGQPASESGQDRESSSSFPNHPPHQQPSQPRPLQPTTAAVGSCPTSNNASSLTGDECTHKLADRLYHAAAITDDNTAPQPHCHSSSPSIQPHPHHEQDAARHTTLHPPPYARHHQNTPLPQSHSQNFPNLVDK